MLREMYTMIVQLTEAQAREHDQFERAAVDQLRECFDTDCFSFAFLIQGGSASAVSPKLARASASVSYDSRILLSAVVSSTLRK